MEFILPGGLYVDGRLEKAACLWPVTGRLEQKLLTLATLGHRTPAFVTAFLGVAVERIGPVSVTPKVSASLCVADRQYLMLRITALLDGNDRWVGLTCHHCAERLEFSYRRTELPVKVAGADYPYTEKRVRQRIVRLRVPTGADQEIIVDLPQQQALHELLARCVSALDGSPIAGDWIGCLSEDEISQLDAALEDMAPELTTEMDVRCPQCGVYQRVPIDPYCVESLADDSLYAEVHQLASHYHWSERAILGLPRERRHRYLRWIEAERGLHS